MQKKILLSLSNILSEINYKKIIKGKINIIINNVNDIRNAKKNEISFLSNIKYLNFLQKTKASAVFVQKKHLKYLPKNTIALISEKPEQEFLKVINLFYPDSYYTKSTYKFLTTKQIKSKFKKIKFGLNLCVEENVSIGFGVLIGNNVTIKKNSIIGNNSILGSSVVIESSVVGKNVHICDGSIIGKKGFSFKFINGHCYRVPHIGKVLLKDNVEIGANCVVDRGSFSDTVIGKNTFIDNLVHIAHNVVIGENCIVAGQVGIAGSTTIGNNVSIGGQSGISGHLLIGNNVKIGGKSGVVKDINDNQVVMGYPAKPFKEFIKSNR